MPDILIYSWFAFAFAVAAHRYLRGERVTARAPGTWLGIAIQAFGFSAVWMMRSSSLLGLTVPRIRPNPLLDAVEALLGLLSISIAISAIWILGRNWSVAAQVIEGHRLVTEGPYRFVRHPIYLAMFGMLLATALSIGNPVGLVVGITVFILGTYIRVHFEERLLRDHFGPEFQQYALRVPAFLPFARNASSAE